MSEFGLTPLGYKRKRLANIKLEIQINLLEKFGAINFEPDSVVSQFVGIFASALAELYEDTENVYFSQYPATADGVSLDNSVDLVGISRLEATNTRVIAALTGVQGTFIPAGQQVSVVETGEIFTNPLAGTITRSNAILVNLQVSNVVPNFDYSVVINGFPFVFNSGSSPTASSVIAGLKALIDGEGLPILTEDISAGVIEIKTSQINLAFSVIISDNLSLPVISSPIEFRANNTGRVLALAGTLTDIITPVAGWNSITNFVDGVLGRDLETDSELRIRRLNSLRVAGSGSVEAIRARLRQNVPGVLSAFVFENREPYEVNGMPPHSFEAIVEGGSDIDIANTLWNDKPAGIQTHGNIEVLVLDSNGDFQAIRFSRPTPVYTWVQVQLRVLPGAFPSNGVDAVRESILNYGQSLTLGEKIIYQQFYTPIYQVAGILEVTLGIAVTANPNTPPVSYETENIPLAPSEIALFDLDRIFVSLV